jgi:CRISPR-associated protein Cmr4
MLGPVWITCPSILKDFKDSLFKSDDQITIDLSNISDFDNSKYFIQTELIQKDDSLNLGWIYLQNNNNLKPLLENDELNKLNINKEILNRLVLVPDKLFSQIVNDNLEVRTSNAIDPATGAAEDGALYSYEAIPRATVMWFDVVYNKPEYFKVPVIKNGKIEQEDIKEKWDWLKENVEKGFSYFEYLGIGGMGTRGMGRIKILNLKDQDNKENNNTSKTNKETNDDINNQN